MDTHIYLPASLPSTNSTFFWRFIFNDRLFSTRCKPVLFLCVYEYCSLYTYNVQVTLEIFMRFHVSDLSYASSLLVGGGEGQLLHCEILANLQFCNCVHLFSCLWSDLGTFFAPLSALWHAPPKPQASATVKTTFPPPPSPHSQFSAWLVSIFFTTS